MDNDRDAFEKWALSKYPVIPVWWTDDAWETWQAALVHSKERIAELEKDAERYRWLCEAVLKFNEDTGKVDVYGFEGNALACGNSIENAIDVAMKGSNDD